MPKIFYPRLSHLLSPTLWSFTDCLYRSALSEKTQSGCSAFTQNFLITQLLPLSYSAPQVHSPTAFQSLYLYFLNSVRLPGSVCIPHPCAVPPISKLWYWWDHCICFLLLGIIILHARSLNSLMAFFFFFLAASYGLFLQQLLLHGPMKIPLSSFTTNI